MPRYWVIAPVESNPPELFNKVWQFDLANNLISIGWKQLGDVSKLTKDELADAVATTYPDKPRSAQSLFTNMIWAFYHEILPGDIVIARRGLKTLAGVGKVTQPANFSPGKSPFHEHPSFLSVEWQEQPRDKTFPTLTFQRRTLSAISEEKFQNLVHGTMPQSVFTESTEAVEDPSEFVLEKYLEDFIVSNFNSIFKGELQVYEENEPGDGQQYDTGNSDDPGIGLIDILAVEPKANAFVVIELKKGRSSDRVVGQILRYMGWVKMNLCKNGQPVKGLIICRDHDPKLTYALEMTSNIDVRYYSVSFKLSEKPQ